MSSAAKQKPSFCSAAKSNDAGNENIKNVLVMDFVLQFFFIYVCSRGRILSSIFLPFV